jgi:hypothetical protein
METQTQTELKAPPTSPSPWTARPTKSEDYPISIWSADHMAAGPICEIHIQTLGEEVGNAAHIAAAPELLAACEGALAYLRDEGTPADLDIMASLRAAIAKAKGVADAR